MNTVRTCQHLNPVLHRKGLTQPQSLQSPALPWHTSEESLDKDTWCTGNNAGKADLMKQSDAYGFSRRTRGLPISHWIPGTDSSTSRYLLTSGALSGRCSHMASGLQMNLGGNTLNFSLFHKVLCVTVSSAELAEVASWKTPALQAIDSIGFWPSRH